MNTIDTLYYVWPWAGAGIGLTLAIILLFTDMLRSDMGKSRWSDPVWLSWAIAAGYLFHVLEEYGLFVSNGEFVVTQTFASPQMTSILGTIPNGFFPLYNMSLTWLALPMAALLSRRNPVIGLSGSGFMFVNACTHFASDIISHEWYNPGSATALFIFVPLLVLTWRACIKEGFMPRHGLAKTLGSGVIGHVALFSVYGINVLMGHAAMMVWAFFAAFVGLLCAFLFTCSASDRTFLEQSASNI